MNQVVLQWDGRKLNKNIYSVYGSMLLAADTTLTEESLQTLMDNRIHLTDEDLRPKDEPYREWIRDIAKDMKTIYDVTQLTEEIPIHDIYVHYIPRMRRIINGSGLISVLLELKELDDYTYHHNVAVGVISTLIGKWLGYDDATLTTLSLASTLHDIGKVKVPLDILNKPSKLTPEEYELMKEHTVLGYQLILKSIGPGRIADVALKHHEREDGSGYPFGLQGGGIDELSKIVAIADVFHAMTSKRVYKDALPFSLVLKQIHDGAFGSFSPEITTLFLKKVMDCLIGSEVKLSDGYSAVVVMIPPNNPLRPVVRREREFINLGDRKDLNIVTLV